MATKYMHTLDGKPAYFADEQIVFGDQNRNSKSIPLVDSLKTIRFQQLLTKQYRTKHEFGYAEYRYGHVRVKVEANESEPRTQIGTSVWECPML